MTRVFVTGATGVLGRRAIPRMIAAGHAVTAVVRSADKAEQVRRHGATPIAVDLFDAAAVTTAVADHDAIAHLATNIPTGASMATKKGWRTNDRLRRDAAANLSRAAIEVGVGRYVQESITFPYVDGGTAPVDEQTERTYFWGDQSTVDAEAAAAAVTQAGGAGVALRFAMFMADDSAHMETFVKMARKGIWGFFGDDDAFVSFIQIDDAAMAVVAALEAPAGIYNVAEAEPATRGEHRAALAAAVGRERLRRLPGLVEKAGGPSAESLARSHSISSAALRAATGWTPLHAGIDTWKDIA